jgi:putative NADPH-quinone reductase
MRQTFSEGQDPMDPSSGSLAEREILVLMTAGASQAQLAKRDYDRAFHTQVEVGIWDCCGFRDYRLHVFDPVHDEAKPDRLKRYLREAGQGAA